jgi:hypothetical protein
VSSQNEGEQPDHPADPSRQFDAFRARQADDRAQQETQGAYSFPPEYAADPAAVFPSEPGSPAPASARAGTGWGARRWGAGRPGGRLRSAAIFAGVLVLACAVGFGAYEAVGSSGSPASAVSAGGTPAPTPTATGAAKRARTVTVRVVIESIGTDSFTGKLVSTGQEVTVHWGQATRFGIAARPFNRNDLVVGETVVVRGKRTGTAALEATLVLGSAAGSLGTNA